MLVHTGDHVNGDHVRAASFDLDRVEVTSTFSFVEPGISVHSAANDQGADLALSADGTLVYLARSLTGGRRAAWFDRSGSFEPIEYAWPAEIESLVLSPDGNRFLATLGPPLGTEIWMASTDGPGAPTLFALQGELTRRPVWFAGGDSVAFIADSGENRDAYVKPSTGLGEPTVLLDLQDDVDEIVISADGWLVYRTGTVPGARDIFALRRTPGSTPIEVAADPAIDETSPALSPDGQYLAYVADGALGRSQVWVRPFPNVQDGAWLISSADGDAMAPRWSPDGSELFYAEDQHIVATPFEADGGVGLGETRRLFALQQTTMSELNSNFSVSPDGQRFLMAVRENKHSLVLVENFDEELRRRVRR